MAVPKPIMLTLAVALCLVAGGFLLFGPSDHNTPGNTQVLSVSVAPAEPETVPAELNPAQDVETTAALPVSPLPQIAPDTQPTPVPVPPPQASTESPSEQIPPSGEILVSKVSVDVLAGPSTTAAAIYGFPAGRPFRVIGREGGFVKIVDVRSGAGGWIEETSLSPAKRAATPPVAAATPRSTPKPKASTPKKPKATAAPKPAAEPKPPKPTTTATAKPKRGLFGLRRNNNSGNSSGNNNGFGEFLQGAFGNNR